MSTNNNDVGWIISILTVLITISYFAPYFSEENNREVHTWSQQNYTSAIGNEMPTPSLTFWGRGNIFTAIIGALGWIVGVDAWLNILLMPLRIAMYFIIARNIWIGGGG